MTEQRDGMTAALAQLEEASSTERALRILVAERKAGAGSLSTAQWRRHLAQKRVDQLRSRYDDLGGDAA